MKKIPTLFKRDFNNNGAIMPEYSDGTEWVLDGEGTATRKYDGICVLIENGKMWKRYELKYDGTCVLIENSKTWKRYELKPGREAPYGFRLVDFDKNTGKSMGWLEVGNGNEDKWFREAVNNDPDHVELPNGTYELIGNKVHGNPENVEGHTLQSHQGAERYTDVPVEFEALKDWLTDKDIEGLVWHHPDGRMVKIKKKDYRLQR